MKLSEKIWLTRKCRIQASTRLERFDLNSKIIINYYSLFIVILSLYSLVKPDPAMGISLTSASILVLVASLFITSRNFKERSISHKQCYIKLDELMHKVKDSEENNKVGSLSTLTRSYASVLNLTENHSEYDYLKVKYYSLRDKEYLAIKKIEIAKLFLYWGINTILLLVLFLLPLLILLL
ncbi:MAG: hypothetical protein FMNOHCHN_02159 [Ignavibacteriaceae bacterium]|nr:hypothetical protein [Ignavibacteriaceae bacterium]